jgi:tryptophan 2,3-dioxygenase
MAPRAPVRRPDRDPCALHADDGPGERDANLPTLREVDMSGEDERRVLEPGIHRDLAGRLTYAGYLRLDRLLSAQSPVSRPPHHDELLFIVQHQVAELWMKLLIHELGAATAHLQSDDLGPTQKIFARCKQVMRQLIEQWSVLETLTPSEYIEFRDILGPSSGFQSLQYRTIEFMLGNKDRDMLDVFDHAPEARAALASVLEAPSLYDEVLRHLARQGHPVPAAHRERDWSVPHAFDAELVPVFKRIYEDVDAHWAAYHLLEDLVDLETLFQHWRFRHMRTVMRIIGFKRGTGGSSGVGFLKQALDQSFFPELFEVRTRLEHTVDPLKPD